MLYAWEIHVYNLPLYGVVVTTFARESKEGPGFESPLDEITCWIYLLP